mmetsp:Transcript_38928/g.115805  ORF Transcript_38928/g.115805 Transcript_38928/m.115805 type:complete len:233 (-) Transcript_38928:926-1624(-)
MMRCRCCARRFGVGVPSRWRPPATTSMCSSASRATSLKTARSASWTLSRCGTAWTQSAAWGACAGCMLTHARSSGLGMKSCPASSIPTVRPCSRSLASTLNPTSKRSKAPSSTLRCSTQVAKCLATRHSRRRPRVPASMSAQALSATPALATPTWGSATRRWRALLASRRAAMMASSLCMCSGHRLASQTRRCRRSRRATWKLPWWTSGTRQRWLSSGLTCPSAACASALAT